MFYSPRSGSRMHRSYRIDPPDKKDETAQGKQVKSTLCVKEVSSPLCDHERSIAAGQENRIERPVLLFILIWEVLGFS